MQFRGLSASCLFCVALITLAGCLEYEKEQTAGQKVLSKRSGIMDTEKITELDTCIPPIDARAPLITKKAYFALG